MAKRKRNVPKRKRKKGRFGTTASDLIKPAKGEILKEIDIHFSDDKIADKVNKIDKLKSKAAMLIGNIKEIRDKLKLDIGADTINFSNLQEYIKKKGNEAVESLYTMIGDLGLRDTVLKKVKEKIPGGVIGVKTALTATEGAFKILYTKSNDTNKMILNILGNILFDNKELLQKKIKDDKDKENYELLTLAGGAAKAAATATVDAGKKAVTGAKPETKPETTEKTESTPAKTTTTSFGKRKRGPSASLKRMCKKHGVRLTVKRGKKRVYKSSKVLKGECQRKLKNKLKKNFGRKKIKRSGIMPPRKRKTRGKKRRKQKGGAAKLAQILKASARRQAKRARRGASSAARYARRNPGNVAGGLAGLGALGLGAYEGYSRYQNRGSPIRRAYEGARDYPYGEKARGVRDYPYGDKARGAFEGVKNYDYRGAPGRAYRGAKSRASSGYDYLRNLFKRKPAQADSLYGKRRRRRRKSKYDFGKKASKKPSAATRRLCKKLKVRLTVKRGGKRVYKSEAMLKKQCKKAMKRKSKK